MAEAVTLAAAGSSVLQPAAGQAAKLLEGLNS
jgi:hypothetical protein